MVRVVGSDVNNQIMPINEALKLAEEKGLDLVEISPDSSPPVCKLMDYSKFIYEQKKKQKEIKQKTAKVVVKELRFSPNTDDHDFEFKLKHAINFLQQGYKLKADVFFKGRSIMYKEQGELILLKLADMLEDYGKVEQLPKLEGKRMTILISPKKK